MISRAHLFTNVEEAVKAFFYRMMFPSSVPTTVVKDAQDGAYCKRTAIIPLPQSEWRVPILYSRMTLSCFAFFPSRQTQCRAVKNSEESGSGRTDTDAAKADTEDSVSVVVEEYNESEEDGERDVGP